MSTFRTARSAEGKFVQLANSGGQDPRLSLQARGLIYFLLSLPPDKRFTAEWIEQQVPNGRRVVQGALRELADLGYLQRTRTSAGRGKWIWEQVLADAPIFSSDRNRQHETTCANLTSSQVVSSDRFSSDESSSDENRPDKYLTREDLNTSQDKDGEKIDAVAPPARPVAGGPAMVSRRAHASGASARLFSDPEINDGVRFAIAAVYGETWNKTISDEEAVMLFRLKAPKSGRVTSVTAYMTKIFGNTPALDTLLSQLDYDGDSDDYDLAQEAAKDTRPWACPRCGGVHAERDPERDLCAFCVREDIINGEISTPRHVIPNTVICPRCESTWYGPLTKSGICGGCEKELRPPVPVEGWNVSILKAVQTALYVTTGKTVTDEWAGRVAEHILGDAKGKVTAPVRYITTTISNDGNPARFLPTKVAA